MQEVRSEKAVLRFVGHRDRTKRFASRVWQGAAWCSRQQELTDHVASLGNRTFLSDYLKTEDQLE